MQVLSENRCGQEASPVVDFVTAVLKQPLTEHTLLLFNSFINRMPELSIVFFIL